MPSPPFWRRRLAFWPSTAMPPSTPTASPSWPASASVAVPVLSQQAGLAGRAAPPPRRGDAGGAGRRARAQRRPVAREQLAAMVAAALDLHRRELGLHRVLEREWPIYDEPPASNPIDAALRARVAGWLAAIGADPARAERLLRMADSLVHGLLLDADPQAEALEDRDYRRAGGLSGPARAATHLRRSADAVDRPSQRYRHPSDPGDAPRDGRGRSRRRCLRRRPQRAEAGGAGRRQAGQGGGAVCSQRHLRQPAGAVHPLPPRRRGDCRGQQPHRLARGRRGGGDRRRPPADDRGP
ncbi:Uncharacterised protein [Chromobacterium violaceum]|uniref:Tetracyclin repressor SlmA-like C-terminal domain-containing protein n=1 Tax=Chromobacterium violaceum TaxID=536 RepID=A0AAX2MEQ7_CHRVL|nr:Uncharacterised protein [Chromobacterium violaceum]